jgi:hypothetical protein
MFVLLLASSAVGRARRLRFSRARDTWHSVPVDTASVWNPSADLGRVRAEVDPQADRGNRGLDC